MPCARAHVNQGVAISSGRMEILYVPAGGTGRFQVNDTHVHKPLKGYTQQVDIMCIHEQVALNVSSAESKYHKM
jgi:hypothetical protein